MVENPWKVTAIAMALLAMALVIVTALVTGVVVANWKGREGARPVSAGVRGVAPYAGRTPTPADIEACRQYARSQVRNATAELLTDAVVGGANHARFAAAHRACLRGRGYAGAWSWPPLPPNG